MTGTSYIECWQLAGLNVTTTAGVNVVFVTSTDDPTDDGSACVREPRRPRPPAPMSAAAELTP